MSIIKSIFSKNDKVNNLESETFNKMIHEDRGVIVLDVRTAQENSKIRIPNSLLIDFYKPNFIDNIEKLDKSKTYLVYCRSGNRSYSACKQMKEMGFEKVFNLVHGIICWNGEVERS